jgi:hypothetical protein
MKITTRGLLAGIFLFLSSQGFSADSIYNQGYNFGHDAGVKYCKNIRGGRHQNPSDQFMQGCKNGFLDAINGDQTCVNRLTSSGLWGDMMSARSQTCS